MQHTFKAPNIQIRLIFIALSSRKSLQWSLHPTRPIEQAFTTPKTAHTPPIARLSTHHSLQECLHTTYCKTDPTPPVEKLTPSPSPAPHVRLIPHSLMQDCPPLHPMQNYLHTTPCKTDPSSPHARLIPLRVVQDCPPHSSPCKTTSTPPYARLIPLCPCKTDPSPPCTRLILLRPMQD